MWFEVRAFYYRKKEKFLFWLAWKLPKPIVHMCAIRVVSTATTGCFSDTEVPELTAMDAIKRFEDGNATPRRAKK